MKFILFLVFSVSSLCYAQDSYSVRLKTRLEAISNQREAYDNGVVVLDESVDYGSDYPRWSPDNSYYQDDIVNYPGGIAYWALEDSRGKDPAHSPDVWRLAHGPHPYLFLRDTATLDDLKGLLTSHNDYVRCYAVGALAHRKYDGLFPVVVDNLADTSRIEEYTSDVGEIVSPADLMLQYTAHGFSKEQKEILRNLILLKYTHLYTLDDILFYHKPVPRHYSYVREIAIKNSRSGACFVALSKYRRQEDIEMIRTGLTESHYHGIDLFFCAVENFPDQAFKKEVLSYGASLKKTFDWWNEEYYFKCLAAYKDADCLKVLEELANQETHSVADNSVLLSYRSRNLTIIYRALIKYRAPMYESLIKDIEKRVPENELSKKDRSSLENSPWNYRQP